MSTALTYPEPYRFSAGMLALVVHLFFFLALYFGFRWQTQPPEDFMVEMWDTLPDAQVAPEPQPVRPEQKIEPKAVAPVLPPAKADIEIRDKKKKQAEEKAKAAAKAKQEKELRELEAYSERLRRSEQARIRAEVDAATATQVGRFQDMIRSKIRRNMVKQDVPNTVAAEFKVTLLPGGDVMDVQLLKSSGYPAYDNAAERAIYKSQPLPVPTDEGMQKMFRELKLTIKPE